MSQRSETTKHDYQAGDLLNFTKTFPWTGWYNPYSKQIIETRYSINNLKYYIRWIHYQVK